MPPRTLCFIVVTICRNSIGARYMQHKVRHSFRGCNSETTFNMVIKLPLNVPTKELFRSFVRRECCDFIQFRCKNQFYLVINPKFHTWLDS